jgi:DNA invertase Pin-like site-specific DNA recombinase
MSTTAVAYIRRSVSRRGDEGDTSRTFQTEAVRRMAGDDGTALEIIDRDWGRSAATEHTDKRLAFLSLMERIERGEVSTLYAYSCDRLARSVEWSARLLNACERAGTAIVTGEGRFAPGDDGARVTFQVLAVMNENAVRGMARKSRATVGIRRARGDRLGPAPYGEKAGEDFGVVVAAYRETHGLQATARLLNVRGIPSRSGRPWRESAVRVMLRARVPEIMPARRGTRAAARGYLLTGLLVCPHDGTALGAKANHGRWAAYQCRRARDLPDHPRPFAVSEAFVLPWVKEEAARLRVPGDVAVGEDATAERTAIEAKRRRVVVAFLDGLIDRVERDERLAGIEEEAEKIERRQIVGVIPAVIDFGRPVAKVNAALRALWERVDLGPDLRPVSAEWYVPEWRA